MIRTPPKTQHFFRIINRMNSLNMISEITKSRVILDLMTWKQMTEFFFNYEKMRRKKRYSMNTCTKHELRSYTFDLYQYINEITAIKG